MVEEATANHSREYIMRGQSTGVNAESMNEVAFVVKTRGVRVD